MIYKILIGILLLAIANIIFVVAYYLGLKQDYHQLLLIINTVFCVVMAVVFYRQQKNTVVLQSKRLLLETVLLNDHHNNHFLLQYMPNFLCLKDADGRWLLASPDYLASLNLQGVDYEGKTNFELARYPQSDKRALELANIQDKATWHLGKEVRETSPIKTPNENNQLLEITRIPVFDAEKNKSKLILVGKFLNQGEQYQQERKDMVMEELNTYQLSFNSHFCLIFLDLNFRITQVNEFFCKLIGYSKQEAIGKHLSFLISGESKLVPADLFVEGNSAWSGEFICRHQQGFYFPIQLNITQIKKEGLISHYFASIFDITRQKQAENRVFHNAHYDDLTGLVNRIMFFDRLNRFLANHKNSFAVIFFIDLDRFKAVNDSLGHDAGDQLLKEAAARLQSVTRKQDVVARLSGDEFALLMLNEVSHEQAVYSASMLAEKVIRALAEPFYIQRREVFIGASIGISIYPEDGKTPEELLKHADISMYEAKKQGRNNYQFYKQDYMLASQDRLAVEMNLRKAIEKKELQLYYQPQYNAIDGSLCGAEVLIRWLQGRTGQIKMISPDKFISIAEETGLIIDIGQWILQTACLQMKKWLDQGYLLPQISVNVSARQFSDNNFLKSVEDSLVDAGLAAKYLELELTESMLIGDIKQIELQLQRLKKMGIAMVLDDFGTGYSSLSYLKNFPIDVLKIDKSFVRGTALSSKNANIACAIINMGHSLGQKVIAEGVETKEQLIFLKNRGCDVIQGYYFSPPLPVDKMTSLLRLEAAGSGLGKMKSVENPNNLFLN